jgi:hypothetical protein
MPSPLPSTAAPQRSLEVLDRVAIAYLTLPLAIFLAGWLELWAALPLLACLGFGLRHLGAAIPAGPARFPLTPLQLGLAVLAGCGWTALGGTGHLVFANADWFVRDAVLHDLVVSPWPVGYGLLDGKETILRAPVAYFLPAALAGKWVGLPVAHLVMAGWTASGATLFLLQVMSLTPARAGAAALVVTVIVLFSGMDIVGSLLNGGPHFRSDWNIAKHLEWWAQNYQYSSMTTQLFWVPNHALGGWLAIGLLYRDEGTTPLDLMLPLIVVAVALWSPLTAIGLVPFVAWRMLGRPSRERILALLNPRVWLPALIVGVVVAEYLALDLGGVPKGWSVQSGDTEIFAKAQFFLLEAGFLGAAVFAIRRSKQVALALVILALLPFARLGPANDLVMRASIPSLTVLAIGACLALLEKTAGAALWRKKAMLVGLLAVGAVTPVQEFARAAVLPVWPIDLQSTLVAANCGGYPAHYIARLDDQPIRRLLREPHDLGFDPQARRACNNPAEMLMWLKGLL